MKKLLFLLAVLCFPVFLFASEGFTIKKFDVTIGVHDDGTIEVVEKILVNFTESKQGIYREIPFKGESSVQINGQWQTYPWNLDITGISANKETFVSKEGSYINIRLGTKGVYNTGDVEYDIRYTVDGAFITENKEYDELYWNVTGNEGKVKIRSASFTVVFPDKVKDLENVDYRIYYGATGDLYGGESGREATGEFIGQTLVYNHPNTLSAYEGITFQVRLKKGFIALNSWQLFIKFLKRYWPFILSGLFFIVSFLIWAKWGKDKRVVIMTEFFPPKDVTPSEANSILLQNEKFDISPTLVDLARRGFIIIGKEKSKTYIEKVKDPDNTCRSYEKKLLESLYDYITNDEVPRVYTEDLKDSFYTDAATIESQYTTHFNSKGFFETAGNMWRGLYVFLTVASIFYFIGAIFMFDDPSNHMIFAAFAFVNSIVFAAIMPKKTGKGLDMYQKIKGFREFMSRAEKDKIQRLCAEFPTYFDDTIPYAMIFGMAGRWGNMFDGLMNQPPDWYRYDYGRAGYRPSQFIYSLQSSVGSISHASYSSPSQSSGGSSGGGWSGGGGSWGGSSGGGFGGGGGGSW